jgi:hypothetical protein
MDQLHEHEYILFLVDDPSDIVWALLNFCVGPVAGA